MFRAFRSSSAYIFSTLSFALFLDNFLDAFTIPILPYIVGNRVGLQGSQIQSSISMLLSLCGLSMFALSAPVGLLIDKFSNKKWPLVLALIFQMITTGLIATSVNLFLLCISFILQGIAASALWIVTLATLTEAVGTPNLGKTLGITASVMKVGGFLGPMTSGFLLSSVGYWNAWIFAFSLIVLDLMLRLAMIDKPKFQYPKSKRDSPSTVHDEASPMLPESDEGEITPASSSKKLSNTEYYSLILRQRRIVSSLIVAVLLSVAFNSFNATLALHVKATFQWGPRQAGILFLALAGPSVLLGPFAGWLRDNFGVRWPTVAGTAIATPSFLLIGVAGDDFFPWSQDDLGGGVLVGALVLIGFAIVLTNGICTIEGAIVIDELSTQNPGVFGSQGGYTRFLAITSMLFPVGLTIGPLLAGFLTVTFGYTVMNCVMATLSFVSLIITLIWTGPR